MKMNQPILLLTLFALSAFGFSPYENYLMSGEPTRVGLIAAAKPGEEAAFADALQALSSKKSTQALNHQSCLLQAGAGWQNHGSWFTLITKAKIICRPPTKPHRSGGMSACPVKCHSRIAPTANGGLL